MRTPTEWALDQSGISEDPKTGQLMGYIDMHVYGFLELVEKIQNDAKSKSDNGTNERP